MIYVVEDQKAYRDGLVLACNEAGFAAEAFRDYVEAKKNLQPAKNSLVLMDCSLSQLDQGDNIDGIRLTKELCESRKYNGLPIYMYTAFLVVNTKIQAALPPLVDEYGATTPAEVANGKLVINTLGELRRELKTADLLNRALDRCRAIGLTVA